MTRKLLVGILCAVFSITFCSISTYASDDGRVTSVSIDKSTLTLEIDDTYRLTATVRPSDADNKDLTWTSSDEDVADVDSSGLVVGIDKGTCEIKVVTRDGHFKDTVKVTVTEKAIDLQSMSFLESFHEMYVGDKFTIEYSVFPKDATNQKVTWGTSNAAIATVSSDGIVTAKSIGSCNIKGVTDDDAYTDILSIAVIDLPAYPFGDIGSSPYKTEILTLNELDILQGSEGKFRPGDVLTRAELASVLVRAFNLPNNITGRMFSDVLPSTWYFSAVSAVGGQHILYGYPDSTFRPSGSVSLEEAAAVISRLCIPDETLRSRSVDDKSLKCSEWARVYVDYAVKEGLVDSSRISAFNRSAKRDEIAYMIYNVLKEKGIIKSP